VRSTLRTAGVSSLYDVTALVFEPTGDLSVVTAPVNELYPWLFEAISGVDPLGLAHR